MQLQSLNEVYFGREPVAPIFDQLKVLRKKIAHAPYNININQDPDVIKFNRTIEKIFGLGCFALIITNDPIPNGLTLPVECMLTPDDQAKMRRALIANPEGFKFNKAAFSVSLMVELPKGIFDADWVDDEEIMACVLHEIGHSFFDAVMFGGVCTPGRQMRGILRTVNKMISDNVNKIRFATEKEVDEKLSKLDDWFSSVRDKSINLFGKVRKAVLREASNSVNLRKNRVDYTNEKFADAFATMYGYGPQNQSFLTKFDNYLMNDYYKSIGKKPSGPIATVLKVQGLYMSDMFAYMLGTIQDPHPNTLARCKTVAENLKKELAKESLDPKMKAQLISELDQMNAIIDEYINFPKDEDSFRVQRLFYTKLYNKFGGDRREQDTDNAALFKAIDNRYYGIKVEAQDAVEASLELLEHGEDVDDEALDEESVDFFFDEYCASDVSDTEDVEAVTESVVGDVKKKINTLRVLKKQWKQTKERIDDHQWAQRFVDEDQMARMKKHYETLCAENVSYSVYKRSFDAIAKFVGIGRDDCIMEHIVFKKDKLHWKMMVRYSEGRVKVRIPEDCKLIHVSMADDIDAVNPTFRSKSKGMYMYPTKRCYFTVDKDINSFKAGNTGTQHRYIMKDNVQYAYIDPSCSDFATRAVFVETPTSIPVYKADKKNVTLKLFDLRRKGIG